MLRKARLIAAAVLEYIVMEVALPIIGTIIVLVAAIIMFGLILKYPDLFGLLISIVVAFLERG
jgi:hypothetical protein